MRSAWVFCNTKGGPLRRSHFHQQTFKPLLKRAKLPDIRFHDLRHTSATLLLSAGVHPKVVQERLGHSQISVTLDTYSHVLPTMQCRRGQQAGPGSGPTRQLISLVSPAESATIVVGTCHALLGLDAFSSSRRLPGNGGIVLASFGVATKARERRKR